MIYVCGFIAWCLISVPLGMLFGRMMSDVSRDYAAHNGQAVAPISKKQSGSRLVAKLGRAALSIVQPPSSGGR